MFRINIVNQTYSCSPGKDLLKEARAQMVKVPYACANGGCGLCKVKVIDGIYKMEAYSRRALTDEEREQGCVLLCKTYPLSHLQAELVN